MVLDDFVKALKARLAPLENAYFVALRDGSMTRDDFVETQVQFAHAVFFFSRPMMVLAGRVSNPEVRLPLTPMSEGPKARLVEAMKGLGLL